MPISYLENVNEAKMFCIYHYIKFPLLFVTFYHTDPLILSHQVSSFIKMPTYVENGPNVSQGVLTFSGTSSTENMVKKQLNFTFKNTKNCILELHC